MTEEEAKTKWCPHVPRVRSNVIVVTQEDAVTGFYMGNASTMERNPLAARCIGSACMAWRWIALGDDWKAQTYFDDDGKPVCRADGYCGLAGKP